MQWKMKHLLPLHSKTGILLFHSISTYFSSSHCASFQLTLFSFFSLSLFVIVINLASGKLGRPVIQIEGVTFGYASKNETKYPSLPLFADVHLGIEQSSRIALVGPNGSGKVRGPYVIKVCDDRMYTVCCVASKEYKD